MAYRREDIERVRDTTDFVELVAESTKVKRSGRSVMAICPFHQEKTPSLSVDAARGLYHCFGCGKSGDLFSWVQEVNNLEFSDAVELLARRSGITLQVDPDTRRKQSRRETLVAAVTGAVAYYHDELRNGATAGNARAYLRGRRYDADTVERFQLGFSPPGWDHLVSHMRERGVDEKIMVAAGLASRSSRGRLIDRFRGRIMFPIYDLRGDAVGFGARILDGDGPKYLNSPETPLYHKSRLLYGLNWAKGDIVRSSRAVVVEGYTDVIAMHLADMPVAVATCGTAFGESHLDLLRRFTERVVLAFDSDEAGASASLRGFEHSVPGDLDLRVALLPEGQDPGDLAGAGELHQLRKAIDESVPLMQFRIETELARFDLSEPEGRARGVRAVAALIARHRDSLARREYAVFVARRTGVDVDAITAAVGRAVREQSAGGQAGTVRHRPTERLVGTDRAERELLRLYLANDPSVRKLGVDIELFTDADHRRAFDIIAPAIDDLAPGEPPDLGSLLAAAGDLGDMLRAAALSQEPLLDAGELVQKLQVGALDRRIQDVRRELEQVDPDADPRTYSTRFQELIALERQRREQGSRS